MSPVVKTPHSAPFRKELPPCNIPLGTACCFEDITVIEVHELALYVYGLIIRIENTGKIYVL